MRSPSLERLPNQERPRTKTLISMPPPIPRPHERRAEEGLEEKISKLREEIHARQEQKTSEAAQKAMDAWLKARENKKQEVNMVEKHARAWPEAFGRAALEVTAKESRALERALEEELVARLSPEVAREFREQGSAFRALEEKLKQGETLSAAEEKRHQTLGVARISWESFLRAEMDKLRDYHMASSEMRRRAEDIEIMTGHDPYELENKKPSMLSRMWNKMLGRDREISKAQKAWRSATNRWTKLGEELQMFGRAKAGQGLLKSAGVYLGRRTFKSELKPKRVQERPRLLDEKAWFEEGEKISKQADEEWRELELEKETAKVEAEEKRQKKSKVKKKTVLTLTPPPIPNKVHDINARERAWFEEGEKISEEADEEWKRLEEEAAEEEALAPKKNMKRKQKKSADLAA